MRLEVVIPAYNAARTIDGTLRQLSLQSGVPHDVPVSVVVVDDGSSDDTVARVQQAQVESCWPITCISQSRQGAAAARNAGVLRSTADVVLLLGADIWLRPEALRHHIVLHQRRTEATVAGLGMVKWDPRLRPSAFMEWMVHGGPQNDFDSIIGEPRANPAHFFYASHVSVKPSLLQENRFVQDGARYGWEDLELGRRLKQANVVLQVLPEAVGLHRHYYDTAALRCRQQFAGQSFRWFCRQHNSIPCPAWWRGGKHWLLFYTGAGSLVWKGCRVLPHNWAIPALFSTAVSWAFWQGYWLLND